MSVLPTMTYPGHKAYLAVELEIPCGYCGVAAREPCRAAKGHLTKDGQQHAPRRHYAHAKIFRAHAKIFRHG